VGRPSASLRVTRGAFFQNYKAGLICCPRAIGIASEIECLFSTGISSQRRAFFLKWDSGFRVGWCGWWLDKTGFGGWFDSIDIGKEVLTFFL